MLNNNLPTCPHCKQTDQVQKVTSVFAANTKEWKETSSGTDAWGNSSIREETKRAHTVLGLKLKLPDEPAQPTHPGLWYGLGGIVLLMLSPFACSILLIPLGLLGPLVGGLTFLPDFAGIPSWVIASSGVGLSLLCCFGLGFLVFGWLGLRIRSRFTRDMESYRAKKVIFDRDELPRWQRAKQRWETMFYCLRDETIFIPAENKAIKADDLEKYIYDPHFRS